MDVPRLCARFVLADIHCRLVSSVQLLLCYHCKLALSVLSLHSLMERRDRDEAETLGKLGCSFFVASLMARCGARVQSTHRWTALKRCTGTLIHWLARAALLGERVVFALLLLTGRDAAS